MRLKIHFHPELRAAVWLAIGLATLAMSCVESIDLPVKKADVNFLVIDGYLNIANAEVNVKLMRAGLISEVSLPFEEGATVALEDSDGNRYALSELDSGRYTATAPSLEPEKQYRLSIKTAAGKEYLSAFVSVKSTPEIDSVGWRADADGTQLIVDTYDNSGETRYYRWTFEETWEYRSRYVSWWKLTDSTIDVRNRDEMVNVCFRTVRSKLIYTTTTIGLSEDVVNDFELNFLPQGTEKLSHQYSILVKQYAISKETYEYLEKLKKTSQDLGGLYAPQPSKVTGNVFNEADPSEVVLGYFDAGQVKEKRIFIRPEDLPDHLRGYTSSQLCYIDTLGNKQLSGGYVILDQVPNDKGEPAGFTFTSLECGDCRVKGGVIAKPAFMPKSDFWP